MALAVIMPNLHAERIPLPHKIAGDRTIVKIEVAFQDKLSEFERHLA